MLQNAFLLAKIGADTAENELNFAELLPIGRRVADRGPPSLLGTENERLRAQLEKVRPPAARKAGPRSGAPAS